MFRSSVSIWFLALVFPCQATDFICVPKQTIGFASNGTPTILSGSTYTYLRISLSTTNDTPDICKNSNLILRNGLGTQFENYRKSNRDVCFSNFVITIKESGNNFPLTYYGNADVSGNNLLFQVPGFQMDYTLKPNGDYSEHALDSITIGHCDIIK